MQTFGYDFLNVYNGRQSPGTVHAASTSLGAYFRRYLFQKAISVFELKGEPEETWNEDYFWYVLYGAGYIAVLDVPGFGPVPQYCTIKGYNLYYQPKGILVTNAAINNGAALERKIGPGPGADAVLMKLTPDYCGIADLVGFYADLMAVAAETMGINILNSKLAYVFASKNKNMAQSFKKLMDNINAGQPAQFVDEQLFDAEGNPKWITFAQDLRSNFIAPDLLETMDKIERMFENEIGIPNTGGTEKKERLITDEVNANNVSTYSKAELWLRNLQEGAEAVNEMFDLNISIDWREIKGRETYGSESMVVDSGTIQNES